MAVQGIRLAILLRLERLFRIHTFPRDLLPSLDSGCRAFLLIPYWPLPAKVTVQVGDPIMLDKANISEDFQEEYRRVHSQKQSMMKRLYARRRWAVLSILVPRPWR